MQNEPVNLICALADAPRVVPGSIFDRACEICKRPVMVAPTGQRILATMAEVHILCAGCFEAGKQAGDTVQLAGTVEEIRKEVQSARANRRRN